jgi:hypothetical protein
MKDGQCYLCDDLFKTDYIQWVRNLLAKKDRDDICEKCKELTKKPNPYFKMAKTDETV